ncbi:tRNA (adenosine(37)-N6)-threonylcarbamoyltransferase complex ATPase subunit type 1 TsaE, partial [Gemmatimonadota bacterium]
ARGAGVVGPIPSPTFNLLFRYHSGRGFPVLHMDLYRIDEPGELWELGWDDLGGQDELVLLEWPERAGDLLPGDRWDIELDLPDNNSLLREVVVSRRGCPPPLPAFPVSIQGSSHR